MTYRVGRSLGRTVYRGDDFIGIFDTQDDAAAVVELLNARDRVLSAPPRRAEHLPQQCQDASGAEVPPQRCEVSGPHYVSQSLPEDQDRNARAYGWEVGRGKSLDESFQSSPDNPFLNPTWREGGQTPEWPPQGTSAASPPACPRVGLHNCAATGEWQNHDRAGDRPDVSM